MAYRAFGRIGACGCARGSTCLCPGAELARVVAGRHTVSLLSVLANQSAAGFVELRQRLGQLSSSTLSARLATLEAHALVVREVSARRPVRVMYSLSKRGHAFARLLMALLATVRGGPVAPQRTTRPLPTGTRRRVN